MALVGVHIVYGLLRPVGGGNVVFGDEVWSQSMAAAGVTGAEASAPKISGDPAFLVRTSVDIWVAVGKMPNAGASPRRYIAASDPPTVILAKAGDKLAWGAA